MVCRENLILRVVRVMRISLYNAREKWQIGSFRGIEKNAHVPHALKGVVKYPRSPRYPRGRK